MTPAPPPGRAGAWRGLLAPGLATLLALGVLVGLGVWQLERRAWKDAILAKLETRTEEPPGDLAPEATWPAWRAEADEFRRVQASGTFLHDREALVHGIRPDGSGSAALGFYVFTPLRRDDGSTVIVNRGFVPSELKEPARRATRQIAGRATVTGFVRAPETRGIFVPANDPAKDAWFVRDPAAMAASRGLERTAPFYLEADATPNPGGWPKGGRSGITLPNNHLQYALTWFALALSLLIVFGAFAWRRIQAAPPPSPHPAEASTSVPERRLSGAPAAPKVPALFEES